MSTSAWHQHKFAFVDRTLVHGLGEQPAVSVVSVSIQAQNSDVIFGCAALMTSRWGSTESFVNVMTCEPDVVFNVGCFKNRIERLFGLFRVTSTQLFPFKNIMRNQFIHAANELWREYPEKSVYCLFVRFGGSCHFMKPDSSEEVHHKVAIIHAITKE